MQDIEVPPCAYEPRRKQYSSTIILKEILNMEKADSVSQNLIKILGIANVDLCTPILTFVFGEAQLGGKAAVISLCRLHQEFYGLPPDTELLIARTVKEVLHELGHTFGLTHCQNPKCVMYFSNSVRNIDNKTDNLCNSCSILLSEKS